MSFWSSLDASGRFPASAAARAWLRLRAANSSLRWLLVIRNQTINPTAATAPPTAISCRLRSRYQGVVAGTVGVRSRVVGCTVVAMSAQLKGVNRRHRTTSAPGVTRTRGQQFRKLLLYPSELRGPSV